MSSAKSQHMKSVLATMMGLLSLIAASSAYGQTKVLSVPKIAQLGTNWCWAASGQMIFNYLGATRVQQCDEVNAALSRSDCCGTVACSSDVECMSPGATPCDEPDGGNGEDICIPPSATKCNTTADCKNTEETCAPTTVGANAGYFGQCSKVLCRSGFCTDSTCAGTCTPASCDQVGSTQFKTWHFNATSTDACNSIPFATLKSEIDAGRPVEFSWDYGCTDPNGTGCTTDCAGNSIVANAGHVLVAVGYSMDPQMGDMVCVNDPDGGLQYWLTYAQWLNNPTGATIGLPTCPSDDRCSGVHFASGQTIGITDDNYCNADNAGLSASVFQSCYSYQNWRGRSPVTINYMNNGTVASSFQSVPWEHAVLEDTLSDWQSMVTSLGSGTANEIAGLGTRGSSTVAKCTGPTTTGVGAISRGSGYRPSSVSVVVNGTTPSFTSIWTPSEGAFQSQCGLSPSQLESTDTTLFQKGYVMADLYPYEVSSTTNWCATWVQKSGEYRFCKDLTLTEYDTAFATLSQTMIPVRFAAYDTPSGQRYAALWQPTSTGWDEYLLMSPTTYQNEYTSVENQGLQLVTISSLDGDYSATWAYPRQSGCSSAASGTQTFAQGVYGCAGKVSFDARNSLCAANCQACSAGQFTAAYANSPNNAPWYDYWTNEYLHQSISSGGCAAMDDGTGTDCGSETPMRVCVPGTTTDSLGNACSYNGCGLNSDTQYPVFGGCSGNTTAGTVCCCE